MKENFFEKYKVFLTGLAAALVVVLQEFLGKPDVNWKAVGFAAFIALLSYIANAWRGQGVTILGIIGTLAGTFVAIYQTGNFTWNQFILSAFVAVLAAVASPPKLKEYETSQPIEAAKAEADVQKRTKEMKAFIVDF